MLFSRNVYFLCLFLLSKLLEVVSDMLLAADIGQADDFCPRNLVAFAPMATSKDLSKATGLALGIVCLHTHTGPQVCP